jgi:two-component system, LuxR family, sensor kinase FixL
MTRGMARGREALPTGDAVDLPRELARQARLIRDQSDALAHYKKMHDRSSALAKIGVWECDLATEALTWTDGVYDLFEIPRGSPLVRARILDMYAGESQREMERLRAAAIRDGSGFTLDIHITTAKCNSRWLRLTVDVEQENRRSVRIFGTKQDITEENAGQEKVRALQAELIQVSRRSAMGATASTLAHELNQPLAAIGNFVAGARRMLTRPELDKLMLARGLDSIEQCAQRAADIIRSLRAISGDDARRETVGLNALIREAASLALAGVGDDIAIRYDLADDAVVSVDPVQFQQVIVTLVKNAAEAVRPLLRREIAILSSVKDGTIIIRIDDNGPGLPPKGSRHCSIPARRPNREAWASASPSAAPSSRLITARSSPRTGKPGAPPSVSRCHSRMRRMRWASTPEPAALNAHFTTILRTRSCVANEHFYCLEFLRR